MSYPVQNAPTFTRPWRGYARLYLCSIYFSNNTKGEQRERIKTALGIKKVDKFESYLGLPTLVGRSKYQTFAYLKDRVWKKIQGWKGQLLLRAGKEVLIKAIA